MRKLVLYIAQSLDGFIADIDGGIDWLDNSDVSEPLAEDYGYATFLDSIDTTLMGYNTYKKIVDFGIPFPYPTKLNYVFSKNHTNIENNPVTFIDKNIIEFVNSLKHDEGKDIWLIGGGEINKILLNSDQIDEIIISIIPVVLGRGIPTFAFGTNFKRFKIGSINSFDGSIVQIKLAKN